jgi:hypothetical protein
MRTKRMFAAIAVTAALAAVTALAQQPQRVRGTIESVDGSTLVIKQGEGPDVTVRLTDNVQVFGVVPATLADVKTVPSSPLAPCRSRTAARRRSR